MGWFIRISALLLAVTAARAADRNDIPAIPVVTVLPAGAPAHAFNADAYSRNPLDLPALGYTEQEYMVSGNARIFDYDNPYLPGDTAAHTIRFNPYVDRLLVRKPVDPRKFSGNVILEIINDALNFDSLVQWPLAHRQFTANGDAYVAVTAGPAGIAALKRFSAARYAKLSFASNDTGRNILNCEPAYQSPDETGLIFDVVSQVGSLIKTDAPGSPLDGLAVRHVFATGYSLSALFLNGYINAIEPTLAKPIFDGYFVASGGIPINLNSCAPTVELLNRGIIPQSATAPVFQTQTYSETELESILPLLPLTPFAHAQDSDSLTDRYRFYEIAGSGHVDQVLVDNLPVQADLTPAAGTTPAAFEQACGIPNDTLSLFPDSVVYDRLWANLEEWAAAGVRPPHTTLFGGPDEVDNQNGGLRSPAVDVPTATYYPGSFGQFLVVSGYVTIPCLLFGYSIPLAPASLNALYPNHAAYVNAVTADANALQAQGFLTSYDAATIIAQAASAPIPN